MPREFTHRPIETLYRGMRFRSRLEARWAATFDELGIEYTYEPYDLGGYIPDFLLHGRYQVLVEVRPAEEQEEFCAVAEEMQRRVGPKGFEGDLLVLGSNIVVGQLTAFGEDEGAMGWLGQWYPPETRRLELEAEALGGPTSWPWDWGWSVWRVCPKVEHVRFNHELQGFYGRPCGHYEGGGYTTAPARRMRDIWNRAHNQTRWEPAK